MKFQAANVQQQDIHIQPQSQQQQRQESQVQQTTNVPATLVIAADGSSRLVIDTRHEWFTSSSRQGGNISIELPHWPSNAIDSAATVNAVQEQPNDKRVEKLRGKVQRQKEKIERLRSKLMKHKMRATSHRLQHRHHHHHTASEDNACMQTSPALTPQEMEAKKEEIKQLKQQIQSLRSEFKDKKASPEMKLNIRHLRKQIMQNMRCLKLAVPKQKWLALVGADVKHGKKDKKHGHRGPKWHKKHEQQETADLTSQMEKHLHLEQEQVIHDSATDAPHATENSAMNSQDTPIPIRHRMALRGRMMRMRGHL